MLKFDAADEINRGSIGDRSFGHHSVTGNEQAPIKAEFSADQNVVFRFMEKNGSGVVVGCCLLSSSSRVLNDGSVHFLLTLDGRSQPTGQRVDVEAPVETEPGFVGLNVRAVRLKDDRRAVIRVTTLFLLDRWR